MANERPFGALVPLKKAGAALGMNADELTAAIAAGDVPVVQVGAVEYVLGDTLQDLLGTPADRLNASIREKVQSRRLQPGEDMNSYLRNRGRGAR